jgi:LDH2 family malate/lactate/ureidoglycolate dehydrogenase
MACRSYKGSHLALLVELLAGPLVGGAIADKVGIRSLSNVYVCCRCTLVSSAGRVQKCKCLYSLLHTGRKRQLGQPCDCN